MNEILKLTRIVQFTTKMVFLKRYSKIIFNLIYIVSLAGVDKIVCYCLLQCCFLNFRN